MTRPVYVGSPQLSTIQPFGSVVTSFSCSLTVRIRACHARDRGSIPRKRAFLFLPQRQFLCVFFCFSVYYDQ